MKAFETFTVEEGLSFLSLKKEERKKRGLNISALQRYVIHKKLNAGEELKCCICGGRAIRWVRYSHGSPKLNKSKLQLVFLKANKYPRLATVEHIIPLSLGGGNLFENLDLACDTCNNAKGSNMSIQQILEWTNTPNYWFKIFYRDFESCNNSLLETIKIVTKEYDDFKVYLSGDPNHQNVRPEIPDELRPVSLSLDDGHEQFIKLINLRTNLECRPDLKVVPPSRFKAAVFKNKDKIKCSVCERIGHRWYLEKNTGFEDDKHPYHYNVYVVHEDGKDYKLVAFGKTPATSIATCTFCLDNKHYKEKVA